MTSIRIFERSEDVPASHCLHVVTTFRRHGFVALQKASALLFEEPKICVITQLIRYVSVIITWVRVLLFSCRSVNDCAPTSGNRLICNSGFCRWTDDQVPVWIFRVLYDIVCTQGLWSQQRKCDGAYSSGLVSQRFVLQYNYLLKTKQSAPSGWSQLKWLLLVCEWFLFLFMYDYFNRMSWNGHSAYISNLTSLQLPSQTTLHLILLLCEEPGKWCW